MVREIALVAAAVGLAGGCYNVPQPACGFYCGADSACPDDYTCNAIDRRCHLNSAPAMLCPSIDAGPVDSPEGPPNDGFDGAVAPILTSTIPAPGASGVSVLANVTATFSVEVVGVSVTTFSLIEGGSNTVSGTISYANGSHLATFTPLAQLAANTTYTAVLSSAITSTQGVPFPSAMWTFTTGLDGVPPSVTSVSPEDGEIEVSLSTSAIAHFDEPVMGVDATTFTVSDGATPISGVVTYNPSSRSARFTPADHLPAGRLLTATLSSSITDLSTNPLSGAPVTWHFMTMVDDSPPHFVFSDPVNGDNGASVNKTITVGFDEPVQGVDATSFAVDAAAIPITGSYAPVNGGRSWVFTPDAALPAATVIGVQVTTGIHDPSGNALAAPVAFSFTTQ